MTIHSMTSKEMAEDQKNTAERMKALYGTEKAKERCEKYLKGKEKTMFPYWEAVKSYL